MLQDAVPWVQEPEAERGPSWRTQRRTLVDGSGASATLETARHRLFPHRRLDQVLDQHPKVVPFENVLVQRRHRRPVHVSLQLFSSHCKIK